MAQAQSNPPKNNGIVYAKTGEGFDLPVIDVTNPRFMIRDDPASADALRLAVEEGERGRRRIPKFIVRMMFRVAARRSRLARALFEPDAGFLDGMSTYVMKLGADNLVPPYDTRFDRKLAASPHIRLVRLRMQQTAHLIAEGLIDELATAEAAPLSLINIGGGPALDSINALIVLRRARPDISIRRMSIDVMDSSQEGATFGVNALAALRAGGGPLDGLDIGMRYHTYDWNHPTALEELVDERTSTGAIVAASSEGALFEYGSDDAIIANLKALRANGTGVRLVAGSVTSAETRRRMIAVTKFNLIPRGVEGLAPLAEQAGFRVHKHESALLTQQVLLRPLHGSL
jgi:hypothetical protein